MKRVLVVLALLLVPGIALAAAQLNFDNPTEDGGTLSYNGAGGPVVATDVVFQQVIGVDTPLNNGVSLFCYPVNCLLDFTTGPNTAEGPPIYTFAGGGSLTLIGGLNTAADGSGVQVVPAGSLLAHDGVFDDPSLVLGRTAKIGPVYRRGSRSQGCLAHRLLRHHQHCVHLRDHRVLPRHRDVRSDHERIHRRRERR